MAYAYGSYAGGRVLVLIVTAILARLLTPADFGLVALALTFISFLDMLGNLGMAETLVIIDEREVEEKAETAFAVIVALGVLLTGVAAAVGPLAADIYGEHQLVVILPVLGATFLLKSLGSAHYALAQKRMDFRARTGAELAEVVARGTVGIVLALTGAGVWALILGYVAGQLVMTSVLWVLVPWRPRLRPQRAHLRQLFGFGGALTGIRIVAALNLSVDRLVIGKVLGAAPLGLYSLASRLPELVLINLTTVAGGVLFPAFAAVERPKLARAMVTSLRYALLLVLPFGALLGVLAGSVLVAVFGDQWSGATSAMQLFTVMGVLSPVTLICGTIWKATGQGGRLLRFALLELVTLVPAVIIFAHNGIEAVAACQAGSTVVVISVSLPGIMKMLGISARTIVAAIAAPIAAATAMGVVLYAVDQVMDRPWPTLVVGMTAGGAVYAGMLWLTARETIRELWAAVRPRLGRAGPPVPADDTLEPGMS